MSTSGTGASGNGASSIQQALVDRLDWRLIGPHRGGRVAAVAGHPTETGTFYFGACAGGVWKTTDGGNVWENISDGYFNTAAVGALAISESDPNVIYAGTGETSIRGNVSHGDGVYKSTDGGRTWKNVGLSDSHAIGRIRVHPNNPDLVYVAALGHVWGPNRERGVYRSKDGGNTWEQVLFRSEKAGAIDLTMDPSNPRILYASTWEAQRYPYKLNSGGPGSGIFRTTDGGDTWEEISRNPGLPEGVLGKIGLAASPKPGRVWALVEAEDGALFRSDNGGHTWERVCDNDDLRRRAWYYMHIYADPRDADTVWVLNLRCWKSIDGGKNFTNVPTTHGDNQDLWIDPKDTSRMIEGNDGGASVTFNGGLSWSTLLNQPTAQFYHVTTDSRHPYRVYGSQQDNTAWSLPSRSARGAITPLEYFEPGGGESGYIAVRPDDPDVMFAGAIGSGPGNGRLTRFDRRTMETRLIHVWPEVTGMGVGAEGLKYRFQWTFPIELSPHDSSVLYVTSNYVHRSTDDGMSWEVMSPDLSRADPHMLEPSGGPITRDNTGAEAYGTIFAFRESEHTPGLLWAGTDDGLVHVSRDGGDNWKNITPSDLPEWALISIIEPSPHDAGTIYVAATRYKHDDFAPYLYKTSDYGDTWTKITNGIPENDFTRTIREDPKRKGLLFAGTETGLYVSFNDGGEWQRLGGNLPVVPIHDLVVKDDDLVVATHGRSFWILDDLSPFRQLTDEVQGKSLHLFEPKPVDRFKTYGRWGDDGSPAVSYGRFGGWVNAHRRAKDVYGQPTQEYFDAGKNPPNGVAIYYYLGQTPEGDVRLEFLDADGKEVRSFSSADENKGNGQKVTVNAGMNRFVWDMRYPPAKAIEGHNMQPESLAGPVAVPGRYQVRLTVGDEQQTQPITIGKDERVSGSDDDLQAQFELLMRVRDKLNQTHEAVLAIRSIRGQVASWAARSEDLQITGAADEIKKKLTEIEEMLIQPKASSALAYPSGLNDRLAALPLLIGNADTRPTRQSYEVFEKLSGQVDEQLDRLEEFKEQDLKQFQQAIQDAGIPAISV
jgi:photosystem II stability/assembly factor-like uncharacterized protein